MARVKSGDKYLCKHCEAEFVAEWRKRRLYCSPACAGKSVAKAHYNRQPRYIENDYKRKRHRERKLKAINYLGGHCKDCGWNADPRVFQFDHLPEYGPRIHTLSQIFSKSYKWETVQAELDKCDLVCANCHMIRSWERGQFQRATKDGSS